MHFPEISILIFILWGVRQKLINRYQPSLLKASPKVGLRFKCVWIQSFTIVFSFMASLLGKVS